MVRGLPTAVVGVALGLFAGGCVDFNVQCTPDVPNPTGVAGYLGATSSGQPVPLDKTTVRSSDNTMGQLLTEAAYHAFDSAGVDASKLPSLAVENSGAIRIECRQSLSPGKVLRSWLRQIIPFDDLVYVFPATFVEIQRAFEHSVSSFSKAGNPPNLKPGAQFLQVYGVRSIVVDCSYPTEVLDAAGNLVTPGQRIRQIHIASRSAPNTELCTLDFTGTPPSDPCPGSSLWVAGNDYIYGGGDGYTAFSEIQADPIRDPQTIKSPPITSFNAAANYWAATYSSSASAFPGDPARRYQFNNCALPP